MIRLKHLSFSREFPILDDINLSFRSGTFYGIVGPSGAGKSSLLKIMAGLLDASSGEIILDGEKIAGPKDRLLPGHPEIQLVNQDFELDLYHTVEENIRVKAGHLPQEIRTQLINELLDLLELEIYRKQKASEISGGEQQRLSLARALASEPKILLLDEPFVHLDVHIKRKITAYLSALKRIRKTTFILVTHDGQEVLNLADQIVFLHEGKIQRISTPEDFYQNPVSAFEGLFFGHLNVLSVQRKKIMFRPSDFSLTADNGQIELEVSYKKSHFWGVFYLHEFLYKKQSLYLQSHLAEFKPDKVFVKMGKT